MEDSVQKLLRDCAHDDGAIVHGIEKLSDAWGDRVFQEALRELVCKDFDLTRARFYWKEATQLRSRVNSAASCDGFRPALLCYLHQVREIRDPRIIEALQLEEIRRASVTDGLTGLFQQTHFKACLEKELAKRKRMPDETMAVVLLDLDHFKQYNDRSGHLAGDQALRMVAETIRHAVREGDLAARYGGEEFALLLTGVDRRQAFQVAERIRTAIEKLPFENQDRLDSGSLTISGGMALYPEDGETAQELLQRADEELYQAKATRNVILPRFQERRRAVRHKVRSIVELAPEGKKDFHAALSLDVSTLGASMGGDLELAPGSILQLRFSQPFWPMEVTLTATIRYLQRDEETGLTHIGVEFCRETPFTRKEHQPVSS